MKKLILVQWDVQAGPHDLVAFPPDPELPGKEILLKIWARHEMNQTNDYIVIREEERQICYCSLRKTRKMSNQIFFILVEIPCDMDDQLFREILETVADNLIENIDHPHFAHILSDTYRTIKAYADLDEDQLFLHLFEDKIRIRILEILRQGVISKSQLKSSLEKVYGYTQINIDLHLTPFLRLNLITILSVPGGDQTIFLLNDLYCCRLPPRRPPSDSYVIGRIFEEFQVHQIVQETQIEPLVKLSVEPGVKELIALLEEDNPNGIGYEIALTVLKNDSRVFEDLMKQNIIILTPEMNVFLLTKLHFFRIKPRYLPPILVERYEGGQISIDQLLHQLDHIK